MGVDECESPEQSGWCATILWLVRPYGLTKWFVFLEILWKLSDNESRSQLLVLIETIIMETTLHLHSSDTKRDNEL